ncbi:hypothetical protein NLY44_13100 [Mesorhizobium sp. C089B]|uniref:hypothetical protein n=1 Tax=Mesorhizobium sp. C089B TaxID=2956823 RepID=UPI0025789DA1|nr:hypothetical protein [Mesorhizobium sp. C089B]WJI53527.1 hypothetical protein NLY44_13100 [Mesorhizobium sp. C089B]
MAGLGAQCLDFWWLEEPRWARLSPKQKQAPTGDWIVSLADDRIRVRDAGAPEFQPIPLALHATTDEISTPLAVMRTQPRSYPSTHQPCG